LDKANVAPSLEYSVVRPNGCMGISCACLATTCSVVDLEVRCDFSCDPMVAKKYTTDTSINEELKGGVFYDSGVVFRNRDPDVKLLVYREKDTLKICQNPDCKNG